MFATFYLLRLYDLNEWMESWLDACLRLYSQIQCCFFFFLSSVIILFCCCIVELMLKQLVCIDYSCQLETHPTNLQLFCIFLWFFFLLSTLNPLIFSSFAYLISLVFMSHSIISQSCWSLWWVWFELSFFFIQQRIYFKCIECRKCFNISDEMKWCTLNQFG